MYLTMSAIFEHERLEIKSCLPRSVISSDPPVQQQISHLKGILSDLELHFTSFVSGLNIEEYRSHSCKLSGDIYENETQFMNKSDLSREEVLASLSYGEISRALHVLNKPLLLEKNMALLLYPQYAFDHDSVEESLIDEHIHAEVLIRPYQVHYNAARRALNELHRITAERRIELMRTGKSSTFDVLVTTVPSKWMVDFLSLFEKRCIYDSLNNGLLTREMENIFYKTSDVYRITPDARAVRAKLRNYHCDIGYHCVRFAALFTTLRYIPKYDIDQNISYTDFEMLCHFAMRRTDEYEDFLMRPSDYLFGEKFNVYVRAIQNAVDLLKASCIDSVFCVVDDQLQLCNGDDIVSVPENIIVCLVKDVMDNIERHEQERVIDNAGWDPRIFSPIGRMLNFDRRAAAEFMKIYKKLGPSAPEKVNGRLLRNIGKMECVTRVYAMLITASMTMYALKDETGIPNIELVIDRCVTYDLSTDTLLYNSTAEAFPGLLFYIMLKTWVGRMSDDKPPDMLMAFLNAFSMYVSRIPHLDSTMLQTTYLSTDSTKGIRWLKNNVLRDISILARRPVQEARAIYINHLKDYSLDPNKGEEEEELKKYFKDSLPSQYNILTPEFHKNYTDFRMFFALPVMYRAKTDLVEVKKPQKKSGQHSSNSLIELLEQIRPPPQDEQSDMTDLFMQDMK